MEYDNIQFEKSLANGFFIYGPVMSLSELNENTIENFRIVLDVSLSFQTLLDPSNRKKTLIILRNRISGERLEIITSETQIINRAKRQRAFQDEPIALLVRISCSALGGRSSRQRIFHLDELVPSLQGLLGWEFELSATIGMFVATKRLETTEMNAAEDAIDSFDHLLDALGYTCQVGFHIQHVSVSHIPRAEPTISDGPIEQMLKGLSTKEIKHIETKLLITEVSYALKGLNQSYVENCLSSRLSMLWAAAEQVFVTKAQPLLSSDEIDSLLAAAETIASLRSDATRLGELKNALQNPDRLPLKNRNWRIAESIAKLMKMSTEDVYKKVREASVLRGKNVHRISSKDVRLIEESESFLQGSLTWYVENSN